MPCLEENPKPMQVQSLSDVQQQQQSAQQEETAPVREITQTDVLNNRLLKSLLTRMNTGDITNKFTNMRESAESSSEFED